MALKQRAQTVIDRFEEGRSARYPAYDIQVYADA